MFYFVGIDVSKHFHVAYVIDGNEKIISSITFENNLDGYNKFISVLENIDKNLNRFSVVLEATGIYFENLFLYLKEKIDKLILLNPFISNKFREFINMNKTKTDKIDALNLAKIIKNNSVTSSYVSDEFIAEMKYLNRFKLEKQRLLKNYKKQLNELLCVVFPEYETLFKNIFSKTSLTLLKNYPTAFHFKKATPKKLVKLFRGIKGNNFNEEKAKKIISLAKNSVYQGNALKTREMIIKDLVSNIEKLDNDIKSIEEELKNLLDNNTAWCKNIDNNLNINSNSNFKNCNNADNLNENSVIDNLRSIPGISDKTIITVLSEAGDLNRFKNVKKFVAFSGMFPEINQSGKYNVTKSLSKKGNKKIKTAFYQAAVASIRHNPEMKKLYLDNISKGRSKKEALIIVARKLMHIFYSIYKHNTPYNPDRVFKAENLVK